MQIVEAGLNTAAADYCDLGRCGLANVRNEYQDLKEDKVEEFMKGTRVDCFYYVSAKR